MQEMRRRVIALRVEASLGWYASLHPAKRERADEDAHSGRPSLHLPHLLDVHAPSIAHDRARWPVRKAVARVQAERLVSTHGPADLGTAGRREHRRELIEARQTAVDGREEALLLDARRRQDVLRPLAELGIRLAHRVDHR